MPPSDEMNASLMKALGELTGEVRVMHQNTMNAFENIRQDMRHMEQNTKDAMRALEERMNNDVKAVNGRVEALEQETKAMAINASKHGVVIGGVSTVLTVGIVELIKKIGHF